MASSTVSKKKLYKTLCLVAFGDIRTDVDQLVIS